MRFVVHNHFPARVLDSQKEFPEAMAQARSIDPLRYLRGLKELKFIGDTDKWHADYDFDNDTITIRNKFHRKPFMDKVQILLHEIGHRGQSVDPKTFKAFKAQGLATVENFLAMANEVHREEYKKHGIGASELADECFAESYSRFALGMDMPEKIRQFWAERTSR